ncbi:MAG: hypothetical protein KGL39_07790 [Patescibacteria group bacterium]|nr:hypothetical protein [Patescibacteria group bacterium]
MKVRALQVADWLEDLGEFAAADVAAACLEWRRSETKRPTIADIRKIILASKPPRRESSRSTVSQAWLDSADRRAAIENEPRRYAEAREARERWAREHGCKDFAEAMQIGLQAVGRRKTVGEMPQ